MGSWHVRASAASITGACVFAVATGAGAVFVGDWWGSSHHSTVITQFVTAPASRAHGSHPAVTRSTHPARAARHTSGGTTRTQVQAQADVKTAQVARSTPAHPAHPAHPAAPGSASDGQGPGPGPGQGNGQGGNGSQGPGGPDPTSAPATPTASASTPAPAATPTAGTAGGDQG
jgi:hypothetical protein